MRLLVLAREWGVGMLAFGVVFLAAVVAGAGLFILAKAVLPPPLPADDDDEAGA